MKPEMDVALFKTKTMLLSGSLNNVNLNDTEEFNEYDEVGAPEFDVIDFE